MKMLDWRAIRLRINEVDDQVRSALSRVSPHVAAHLPKILDDFYRLVAEHEPSITKVRDPGFMGESISLHQAHWKLIGTGCFGDELGRSATAICELHQRLGLLPHWYIGSRIMFLSTRLRALLLRDAQAHSPGRRRETASNDAGVLLEALTKASFIDLEMTVGLYFGTARQVRKSAIASSSVRFKEMIAKLSNASIELEGVAKRLSD
jgi:Protoglobin